MRHDDVATVLQMNDVHFRRGDFHLQVERLSLSAGRFYALKGSNGAGKSTLLNLLALLERPQRGELLFCGEPVIDKLSSMKRLRQQVTLLEQNPLLFSGTVAQNLAFGLKLRGVRGGEQQRRIADALAATGLQGFAQRLTRELSGGEARRAALARALVLQPKLLLLDEPTANLDVGQVAALERFLVSLPQQGITVVIATHDAKQPERIGGEVITLESGQLRQFSSVEKNSAYQPLIRRVHG